MIPDTVDLPTFAVDLAIQYSKTLELEQIAYRAVQEALVASEDDRARWIRRHRSCAFALAACAVWASLATITAVWGWVR